MVLAHASASVSTRQKARGRVFGHILKSRSLGFWLYILTEYMILVIGLFSLTHSQRWHNDSTSGRQNVGSGLKRKTVLSRVLPVFITQSGCLGKEDRLPLVLTGGGWLRSAKWNRTAVNNAGESQLTFTGSFLSKTSLARVSRGLLLVRLTSFSCTIVWLYLELQYPVKTDSCSRRRTEA